MSHPDRHDNDDRIAQLEQRVVELTATLDRLAPGMHLAERPAGQLVEETTSPVSPVSSRRNMLKLAGAAAIGAAAAGARTLPVAAADGEALQAGRTVETSGGSREATALSYANTATPQVGAVPVAANIFIVRDRATDNPDPLDSRSSYPSAIGGYSYRTVANGLYGYTAMPGYGVVGYAGATTGTGLLARGGKANLELHSAGTAGPARSDAHNRGELICDLNGDIWACVLGGTPGTWRKLAGTATAGSFHAIAPSRVFDSRSAQPADKVGLFLNNTNRTISLADKRDLTTGAVVTAGIVPVGATAVAANVTVTNTVNAGFLAINPGGTTAVNAAAINWFASGQILNNGLSLTLNAAREVTIICGGGGNTHVVVDITGYFL